MKREIYSFNLHGPENWEVQDRTAASDENSMPLQITME